MVYFNCNILRYKTIILKKRKQNFFDSSNSEISGYRNYYNKILIEWIHLKIKHVPEIT